jgi:hypothetical protein
LAGDIRLRYCHFNKFAAPSISPTDSRKRPRRFCLTMIALTLMALWNRRHRAIDFAQSTTKFAS